MSPLSRRLPRFVRQLTTLRGAAAAPATISGVLRRATAQNGLKNAVKFIQPEAAATTIWTNNDLSRHVNALCAGLKEMGYESGDMIVSGLRRSLPEYSVLRLAAAQLGVKVVAVAEREGGGIDIERVRRSMKSGNGLEGFQFAKGVFLDGGCDNVTDAVRGLVGREIGRDGAGLRGVLRVRGGGRLDCWQFPALQHVVQTGHEGIEGSVTFRSALVYSGEEAGGDGGADYVRRAEEVGARNRLCANHEVREGKVVVMPCLEGHFLHSALAAVLKGALWVHPGQRDGRSVSQHEGALLL